MYESYDDADNGIYCKMINKNCLKTVPFFRKFSSTLSIEHFIHIFVHISNTQVPLRKSIRTIRTF